MRASVHDAEDLMTLEAVDNLGQQVPFPTDGLRRVGRESSVSGTISHAESRWKVISVSQSRLRGARSRTAVSRRFRKAARLGAKSTGRSELRRRCARLR